MAVVVVFMASSLGLMMAVTAKLFLGISLLMALAVWSAVGMTFSLLGILFVLMLQSRAGSSSVVDGGPGF